MTINATYRPRCPRGHKEDPKVMERRDPYVKLRCQHPTCNETWVHDTRPPMRV